MTHTKIEYLKDGVGGYDVRVNGHVIGNCFKESNQQWRGRVAGLAGWNANCSATTRGDVVKNMLEKFGKGAL